MYTLEKKKKTFFLCIICTLLPPIKPLLTLTLVCTWYEESTPWGRRCFYKAIYHHKLFFFLNVFFTCSMILFSQKSKLVHGFEPLSLKPLHGPSCPLYCACTQFYCHSLLKPIILDY